MVYYFGKNCPHFCGQWENRNHGDDSLKDAMEPVLVFCKHPENGSDTEGNCNSHLCPLGNKEKEGDVINVKVYTDGSCLGNPGPGGYAAAILREGEEPEIVTGGFRCTTNNRMELSAVIHALKKITQDCLITVYTDSQYVAKAINEGWLAGWKKKGFMKRFLLPIPNDDLWKDLDKLLTVKDVSFVWVRGHNGDEHNEIVDKLAYQVSYSNPQEVDTYYEKNK